MKKNWDFNIGEEKFLCKAAVHIHHIKDRVLKKKCLRFANDCFYLFHRLRQVKEKDAKLQLLYALRNHQKGKLNKDIKIEDKFILNNLHSLLATIFREELRKLK